MDNYTFYKTFIDALGQDQDIQAWGKLNFDSSVSVFADLQTQSPPGEDDMPYILIHTPEVLKGMEERIQEYGVSIDLAITKNALQIRADDVEEPSGLELILDFGELVVDCIEDALPDNMVLSYRLRGDTTGSLPDIYGFLEFRFRKYLSIGNDTLG